MALPNHPPPEMKSNSSTIAVSACSTERPPPLESFNDAYDSVRQLHDRLAGLIAVLKGEDSPVLEASPHPQCIHELLAHMPDHIRNECREINDQITEIDQILLT